MRTLSSRRSMPERLDGAAMAFIITFVS